MLNEQNKVAKKFKIVISVIKILGYAAAILCAIAGIFAIFFKSAIMVITCWIYALVIALGTWFASLSYEAIAEGLQLLQDIKNK